MGAIWGERLPRGKKNRKKKKFCGRKRNFRGLGAGGIPERTRGKEKRPLPGGGNSWLEARLRKFHPSIPRALEARIRERKSQEKKKPSRGGGSLN